MIRPPVVGVVLPLHLSSLRAPALDAPLCGIDEAVLPVFGIDAQRLHGHASSTLLLPLPVVAIRTRWLLPRLVATVLVAVPAVAMTVLSGSPSELWHPLGLSAGALLAEVGVPLLLRGRRPSAAPVAGVQIGAIPLGHVVAVVVAANSPAPPGAPPGVLAHVPHLLAVVACPWVGLALLAG